MFNSYLTAVKYLLNVRTVLERCLDTVRVLLICCSFNIVLRLFFLLVTSSPPLRGRSGGGRLSYNLMRKS